MTHYCSIKNGTFHPLKGMSNNIQAGLSRLYNFVRHLLIGGVGGVSSISNFQFYSIALIFFHFSPLFAGQDEPAAYSIEETKSYRVVNGEQIRGSDILDLLIEKDESRYQQLFIDYQLL